MGPMKAAASADGARSEMAPGAPLRWWESRWGVALLLLLAAVPLAWPAVPPLGDLPGHMGRYRVELDIASPPGLQRFYSFHWHWVGNLGVDLLVIPLTGLVGLEPAVKLIVMAIPVLTVGGFLWISREIHGRIPAATLFALPLAYNYPFQFGFVNFSLSMALALVAFALWLRLERLGRLQLRAALFVPLSLLLWLAHVYGWAVLGVLAFATGLVRRTRAGARPVEAAWRAALACLPMAPPVLAMIAWRSGRAGAPAGEDWFDYGQKAKYLAFALRDRWMAFDLASLLVPLAVLAIAGRRRRLAFAAQPAFAAVALLAIFAVMPRVVIGSSYADMRIVPYILALALLAVQPTAAADDRFLRHLAIAATAFLLVRAAGNTASLWLYDRSYQREAAALDRLPEGARLVSFVGRPCAVRWYATRLEHLPGLALERKRAFSNDQWDRAEAQPLSVTYAAADGFARDPSQIVVPDGCVKPGYRQVGEALRGFPRQAFDYVWLIQPPPVQAGDLRGLQPVWRNGASALYRVIGRRPAPEATGR
jgi:hypothetical protein